MSDVLPFEEGSEDFIAYNESVAQRKAKANEAEAAAAEYERNLEESAESLKQFAEENNMTPDEATEFVQTMSEMIQDKILSNKRACLYTILSNSPIKPRGLRGAELLTEKEITTQILRYYEDEEPNKKGDLFLDKYGKPQYRVTLLSLTGQPDIDLRSSDIKDYFLPESLKVKTYGGSK